MTILMDMIQQSGLTVREAADRLHVSPQRVHALIRAGYLDAGRFGRSVAVSPLSVQYCLAAPRPMHRPLSRASAWAAIALAGGGSEFVSEVLATPERRAFARVRTLLEQKGLASLVPYLRGRSRVQRFRADEADLELLAGEAQAVRTGASAAIEHGLDVLAPNQLDLYLPAQQLAKLAHRYALEPSSHPNVTVRLVDDPWPFRSNVRVAPGRLAALDLYDSGDPRSVRAGRAYLESHG
jgi:hypothetical protein